MSTTSSTTTSSSSSTVTTTDSFANDWLTYHYNNPRDGSYPFAKLTTNPSLRWKSAVDAPVYAEPLYFGGLVYVATEGDSVYALNVSTGSAVWSRHLGTPVNSLTPPLLCNNNTFQAPDIRPTIGITGTPAIDPVGRSIFVAALIKNTGFVLYSLDLNSGQEKWHSLISADGFYYLAQEERGALAFANGMVYVPFGGYSWDCLGPTGQIFAMSAAGKGVEHHFAVPTRMEADFWTPEGVSADSSGYVYAVSGDSNYPGFVYGNSVIKFYSNLTIASYFAASDWNYTNQNDLDLGSTGATLLPGNMIFAIGKDGVGYIVNATDPGGIGGELYGSTVCGATGAWGGTAYSNGRIYVPCGGGVLALSLKGGIGPRFSSLWNFTGFFAGPPIVAYGAVWAVAIDNGNLFALNQTTGKLISTVSIPGVAVEHFTTPSAGGGLVFLAGDQTIYGINSSS